MKKIYILLLLVSVVGILSCEKMLDSLIPDVSTSLSKTFTIQISQNSGSTTEEILDISSSTDYKDFKNNIKGYELDKITCQIKNSTVPTDMYFSGSIICKSEDGSKTLTAASITRLNMKAAADTTSEIDVIENMTDINTVLDWLKSQGKFKVVSSYALTNAQNVPYPITANVTGKSFELTVRFYIVVKTGLK